MNPNDTQHSISNPPSTSSSKWTCTYEIRNFQENDFPALGEFYSAAAEGSRVVFWWVGEQENWPNVYCAFENGRMIAKGQVDIFAVMPPQADSSNKHKLFFNLKTLPERSGDFALLGDLYDVLHAKALELKKRLPTSHGALLCFGNYAEETENTGYFASRPEFSPLRTKYRMRRDLKEGAAPLPAAELPAGYEWQTFNTLTREQTEEYLALDLEIWPETPIERERLAETVSRDDWRLLQIHTEGRPVASLMHWISDGTEGQIEDVLVREPHRRRGLASALLARALQEIRTQGGENVELDVETSNAAALGVYKSAGFEIETEEHRYAAEL